MTGADHRPGVNHLKRHPGAVAVQAQRRRGRTAGMLERVGERLLGDAKDGELHAARQLAQVTGDLDRHRDAGGLHAGKQLVEAVETRLGLIGAGLRLVAQDAEQASHLPQGLPAGLRHPLHRRARGRRGAVQRVGGARPRGPIITVRLWETMSCISRAMRARSAAAASRPSWSRSNSRRAARSSQRGDECSALTDRDPESTGGDAETGDPDPHLRRRVGRPVQRGHDRADLDDQSGKREVVEVAVQGDPEQGDEHRPVGELRGRHQPLHERDQRDHRKRQPGGGRRAAATPPAVRSRRRPHRGGTGGPGPRRRQSSGPRSAPRPAQSSAT